MKKKLLIFGNGEIAKIAYDNFTKFSDENLSGFLVDDVSENSSGIDTNLLISMKSLDDYPVSDYKIFVALSYRKMNLIRESKFDLFKKKGFEFANFIHPENNIDESANIGENVMILENQTIQRDVTIGNNVIIWSSNHIGHGTKIGDHTYISSHVVISGHCSIGKKNFFGVNSSVADFINIEDECFIGMGSSINKNLPKGTFAVSKNTDDTFYVTNSIKIRF